MAARCPFCDRRIRMRDVDFARDAARCRGCEREVAFSSLPGVADNPSVRRLMERLGVGTPGFGQTLDIGEVLGAAQKAPAQTAASGRGLPAPGGGSSAARPPTAEASSLGVDIAHPSAGAWYRDDGVTLEIGASTRSVGVAILLTLIGGFWCSVTGVFVVVAISSVLKGLGLVGGAGNGGGIGGVGFGLFMLLFCTPFVLIGLTMLWTALMSFGGREVVTIRGDALEHFSGVGPVGFRKRLSASRVQRVEEDVRISKTKNGTSTTRTVAIYADAPKPLKFGSMLSDDRRRFVLAALTQILAPRRE